MSLNQNRYIREIYFLNLPYTPRDIANCIAKTPHNPHVNPDEMNALISQSKQQFQYTIERHNVTLNQRLQVQTSEAGRDLAELVNNHENKRVALIIKSVHEKYQ